MIKMATYAVSRGQPLPTPDGGLMVRWAAPHFVTGDWGLAALEQSRIVKEECLECVRLATVDLRTPRRKAEDMMANSLSYHVRMRDAAKAQAAYERGDYAEVEAIYLGADAFHDSLRGHG